MKNVPPNAAADTRDRIEKIIELARWAPSGDNSQPWRFSRTDAHRFSVLGQDTRAHCIYDLRGHASQLSLGALLQTIEIAASSQACRTNISCRPNTEPTHPVFDVELIEDATTKPHPLLACITQRSVQRRPLSTTPLTLREREQLAHAVGPDYTVHWIEGFSQKLQFAWLLFRNGGLRLHLPEAFETHRSVIEWNSHESTTRIPDRAIGLDRATLKLMRWAMQSWDRVAFLNRYLGGSLVPRFELDLLPGIACAAHFVIVAQHAPSTLDDFVAAGKAVQRFWLTATHLALQLQPEMTPLIFSQYLRDEVAFTESAQCLKLSQTLAAQLHEVIGADTSHKAVFMGRLGQGKPAIARSTRLPLTDLMQ